MMPTHLQGRHPVEVGLLLSCAAAGLLRMIAAQQPSAVQAAMGTAWSAAWGGLLFTGAVLALVGVFWRGGLESALNLERAGVAAVVGALAGAVAAILFRTPIAASITGPIVAGIGGGLLVRIWQVSNVIRRTTRAVVEVHDAAAAGLLGAGGDRGDRGERGDLGVDSVADQPQEDGGGDRENGCGDRGSVHGDGGTTRDERGAGGDERGGAGSA